MKRARLVLIWLYTGTVWGSPANDANQKATSITATIPTLHLDHGAAQEAFRIATGDLLGNVALFKGRAVLALQRACGPLEHAMNLGPEATGMSPVERDVVESREVAADELRRVTGTKRRIGKEEANIRAREALKNKPPRGKRWTERTLAKAIGCSHGLVDKLSAWQAYMEERGLKGGGKPHVPKAVRLTERLEKATGREDTELERLIREHQADHEESPLVSHARKRRRRMRL